MSEESKNASFADVLSGKAEPTPVEPPQETTPEVKQVTQPEGNTEPEVTPPPVEKESREVPVAAVIAERKKRQATEQRVKELEAQLAGYQTPPAPEPYVDNETREFVGQAVKRIEQQVEDTRLSTSETLARSAHPDFDEKYVAFQELALENPSLARQVLADPNPGEAAYRAGKQILFEKQYGKDPEAIRQNLEKEIRANIAKESDTERQKKLSERNNQPTNISNARAAGGATPAEFRYSGFADVLRRR